MLLHEVLVPELGSVDGLTSCAISTGEITTLGHESWNNAMEETVLEVKRLTRPANSFLASAESTEVLRCLWGLSKELHSDTAAVAFADADVEVYLRVSHSSLWITFIFI